MKQNSQEAPLTSVVFVLGGCDDRLPNSTPNQRVLWLSKRFSVVYARSSSEYAAKLEGVTDFVEVASSSYLFRNFRVLCDRARQAAEESASPLVFWASHSWWSAFAAFRLARKLNGVYVADVVDFPALSHEYAKQRRRKVKAAYYYVASLFYRWLITRADIVVRSIAIESEYFKVPSWRQVMVINGVNEEVYRLGSKPRVSSGNVLRVCYVGEVSEARCKLLGAIALKAAKSAAKLVIIAVGKRDERYVDSMMSNLRAYRSTTYLVCTGHKGWNETLQIIKDSDVCLYPFPRERSLECVYPIKLGEYLALGKPCLCSNLRGARELVGDGAAAVFLEPDDAEAWFQTLQRFVEQPLQLEKMARAARQRASELFWHEVHKPLEARLHDVLAAARERRNACERISAAVLPSS